MATLLSTIETRVRRDWLNETTADFWSSAELVDHMNAAIKDLWRATVDLGEEYYLTVDASAVSLAADTATLTGVPTGVYKVVKIHARDLTSSSSNNGLVFKKVDYHSDAFMSALGMADITPSNNIIYYTIEGGGAPVAAPTIRVAPQSNSAVNLTLVYVPVQADLTASGTNPIPGESDAAIEHYTAAMALGKQRPDNQPDPVHMSLYNTLKQSLITSMTPRDISEPEVVEAVFEDWWA